MTNTDRLHLTPRWDLDLVPAGESVDRGLLIDIHAPPRKVALERKPVNLVLVLDRSGSMVGASMAAVIEAACGVVGGMDERDQLAVVCFDNEIDVIAPPRAMDRGARSAARDAVRKLESRGSTDLAGGWFRGAECASAMLEQGALRHAHVVILSDGKANQGLVDPRELAKHSAALAARGVTTSAVGIGRSYAPAQLEALARGGEGRLAHCDNGEDIVDVILGELTDERQTIAQKLTLTIRAPLGVPVQLLSELPHDVLEDGVRIHLGTLQAGGKRSVALLTTPPGLELGTQVEVRMGLEWRGAEDGAVHRADGGTATLRAASIEEVDVAPRDLQVADRILDLWEASLAYRGTLLHSERCYEAAQDHVGGAEERVERFSRGTSRARQRHRTRSEMYTSLGSRAWDGTRSRRSMDLARRAVTQDRDPRRNDKGSWEDQVSTDN